MVDAWPAGLPQCFLRPGPQTSVGDGRIRSTPDTGPAIVRRRSSAIPKSLRGQMKLNPAELDTLLVFGETTLSGWSLPFTFPHTSGDLMRFGESLPSYSRVAANTFMVELSFEILP